MLGKPLVNLIMKESKLLRLSFLCFGQIFFPILIFAQTILTGKVLDPKQNPLQGISIKSQRLGISTQSSSSGYFEINSEVNDSLTFSGIGFKTESIIVTKFQNFIKILEPQDNDLEEVIVVGYGTQKRVHLTGSVSTISSKEIQNQPVSNLTNVVGGRLPGVISTNPNGRPGSGSNLSIRGLSTLNDNSPLIVVDGIVRSDGFSRVDPNDVESITILKDASASAVYGARAANGVFLITTKRGKSGKPLIQFTGWVGYQNPTNYPKLMGPVDYATIRNQALLNQGYDPKNPSQSGLFYSEEQIARFSQNIGTVNWYEESFKTNSPQTQQNITVNGGSDHVKYFSSIGYFNQNGMYDNLNYRRYNFRSNVDARINKNFDIGLNIEGRQENEKSPGYDANTIFSHIIRVRPVVPSYYPSGRPFNNAGEHPVEEIYSSGYYKTQYDIFVGTLSFEHKLPFITEGLSLKGLASAYRQNQSGKNFLTPYSMYTENEEGEVTGVKKVGGETSLSQTVQKISNYTTNLSLNYQRAFENHDVSGLLLFEQYSSQGDLFSAGRRDFISNIKDELFASGPENQTINGYGLINDRRRSLVGRITYAYDSRYLFESSFRYDGSYRFAPGKQYGVFPAFSAGWRVSEESFFKSSNIKNSINNLKLRFSYGVIGNDRVGAFQFSDNYSIVTNQGPIIDGVAEPFIQYGVFPNQNITWEKQYNTNFGIETGLFNNLISFEVDYFLRTTKDILWSRVRSIPETFGRSLSNENYAEMKSSGIDFSISHGKKLGDFRYDVRIIGSYAKNKVVKIDDPLNALDYQKQLNRTYGFRVGYDALGIFQSQEEAEKWFNGTQFGQRSLAGDIKYADVNGDGVISNQDQKILSNFNFTPRVMLGTNISLTYQNLDLNLLIQGAAQRNVLINGTGRVMFQGGGSSNTFSYLTDSWSEENKDAKYPLAWIDSRSINNRDSDVWLKKASYARLKSIDLGYSFNQEFIKRLSLSNAKIFISGYNLFTISQIKEFDPEVESATGSYYPQQRTVNFGVNLTF